MMRAQKGRKFQVMDEAETFLRERKKTFRADAAVLHAARILFDLREVLEDEGDSDDFCAIDELIHRVRDRLHDRLDRSKRPHIGSVFLARKLDRVEREIMLALTLGALGMRGHISDVDDLQRELRMSGDEALEVVKAVDVSGRLADADLVILDPAEIPVRTCVAPCQDFIAPVLRRNGAADGVWDVSRPEELYDKTCSIVMALREHAEHVESAQRGFGSETETRQSMRKVSRLLEVLAATLDRHPDWALAKMLKKRRESERALVTLLLGKELGFMPSDEEIFTGGGICTALSRSVTEVRHYTAMLAKDATLRADGLIRPAGGGAGQTAVEDDTTLRAATWELTPEALETLEVTRKRKNSQQARPGTVRLDQLVLSDTVRAAVETALTQARHGGRMIDDWGLGEVVPYGRSVTLLFSGAPGLGKTATTEALARELDAPVICVNFAEIQNCFVGMTEKNIVRVFREAADQGAVLFWDEADAMFFDRDAARETWDVRAVNVLLQEIERFDGVCVLSTNRVVSLDPALERRIAVKVVFERPDRSQRRAIWEKLVPEKMPTPDIDFDELSVADLTGAEIKNAVLNAARRALRRDPECDAVTMDDFRAAVRAETEGRWRKESQGRMGFRATDA